MCRVLKVHHSGFYAWLKSPLSERSKDARRLTGLIKQSWFESGCVYGYRKIHDDLRNLGERCSLNRVARLAHQSGVKAQIGYKRKPGSYGGKPAVVAKNQLKQSFDTLAPDQVWVTDITYIKTYEGWLYLAVIIDLYSRRVIGWSMQSRMKMDLVLSALLMAVWRRKPKSKVIIHSDQGSQFTSLEWQSLIRRKTYATRKEARQDVFNYIELFYNSKRKHGKNGLLSPIDFERQQNVKLQGV